MLSRAQNIRVGKVDNLEIFLPNMFTEQTGVFITGYHHEIIFYNLLNLVFFVFFLLVNFLLSLSAFIANMVNQLISWL